MRKVAVHTLGCKLNFAESSTIARQFRSHGYEVVAIDEPADVCVINTCSVTERADRECRQVVRRALRHSPNAYVIVAGCYAQLRPEQLAAIPGVDLVLGTSEKFEIFRYSKDFIKSECSRTFVAPVKNADTFLEASSVGSNDRTRAFLKIQDGCDYSCAFCTIPLARGASRSTPIPAILSQAKSVVAEGYQEVVLTGVNVGDYGTKIGTSLAELLGQLALIDGLSRIRISSVEPNLLTDDLISLWAANPKICNHFHIPLQGGNDDILRGMRRRYLTDLYRSRVERIQSLIPEAGIGADVIAGFPGETDEIFEQTYKFLVELPISYLHVFTYSERPNTAALTLPSRIEPRVRFQRSEMLRNLSLKKRQAFLGGLTGSTRDVLFEEKLPSGEWTGLTGEYARVRVKTDADLSNQIKRIEITHPEGEDCIGKLVDTSYAAAQPNPSTFPEVSLCA
ncbi:MAG: tRNA (N(6)-L-threonylcarbamoyladenosine(37)-C(2))-methylthiotransferase MtaB [Ignavibacteriales bacterium]|nr:tRNA (N(6)-L-threonylcarbamoyladenosine(37)-C(2))-methylthiotransferase MtaB [Ignavibacteriales bacterium]